MATQSNTLKLPGATLYYEVWGSGPPLVLIPGGPTDAGLFRALATELSSSYTVVPYDPRGNSRSVLDGPPEDQNMDVHGDDAAALIAELGAGPAYVLGSSGGAQIGLNLAARHPERVHTLVAHEPPCVPLLADTARGRAFLEEVHQTYRRAGIAAGMEAFARGAGFARRPAANEAPPRPPSPEQRADFGRIQGNLEFFLAHGVLPIGTYVPDVVRLVQGRCRIIVGVGTTSSGTLAHDTALALAERLGQTAVVFPGDHTGYTVEARAFAEKLRGVLRAGGSVA
jgi:pimeloyl-ACP methyl ester carboxylesterase